MPRLLSRPVRRCLLCALMVAFGAGGASLGATFVVNSTSDTADVSPGDGSCADSLGNCTLRAAVQESNALAGQDAITLPAGSFAITGLPLDVTDSLIIEGAGRFNPGATIISGSTHLVRARAPIHFEIRDLQVLTGAGFIAVWVDTNTALVENCELAGDVALQMGGALAHDTVVRDSLLRGVHVSSVLDQFSSGSAVPTITIERTEVRREATVGQTGFSVRSPVQLVVRDSQFSGVGEVSHQLGQVSGQVLIENSRFESAGATAGSITANGSATATPPFQVTIRDSEFVSHSFRGTGVDLEVETSTFEGGGVGSDLASGIGSMHLVNSTVSNGNVFGNAPKTIESTTISGLTSTGTLTLSNSILANPSGTACQSATVQSLGHNLIQSHNNCTFSGATATDIVGQAPLLDTLADNGGPTRTHALLAGSPAIDAGHTNLDPGPGIGGCEASDQRGNARPTDGDTDGWARCDIGSYEAAGTAAAFDFGDAPDPTYPTLLASDGARHVVGGPLFLGSSRDSEADGLQSSMADGDDLSGDDEDGVAFAGDLEPNATVDVDVIASAAGILSAWVDFDGNGQFDDPAEALFGGPVAVVAGTNQLSITVPPSTHFGDIPARFRLASSALGPLGPAGDGEVEDHLVTIVQPPDLILTQLTAPATEVPGTSTSYQVGIGVQNNPMNTVFVGATVQHTPPANLTCTWTCVPGSVVGETCSAAGSGAIIDVINIASAATYSVQCSIDPAAAGQATFFAQTAMPIGTNEATLTNNSITTMMTMTPETELLVSITDDLEILVEGATVHGYVVDLLNQGPSSAPMPRIQSSMPAVMSNLQWTCSSADTGICTPSGSGEIDDFPDLGVNASVRYVITGDLGPVQSPTVLSASVTLTASPGSTNTGDPDGLDKTSIVLFADGFESGDLQAWSP